MIPGPSRPKDSHLTVRVEEPKKKQYRAAASLAGVSLGHFVRNAVEAAAREVLLRELSESE